MTRFILDGKVWVKEKTATEVTRVAAEKRIDLIVSLAQNTARRTLLYSTAERSVARRRVGPDHP